MEFDSADECRGYFLRMIEDEEQDIEEIEELLRVLNFAHDFIEERVDADDDDSTWLPDSSFVGRHHMTRLALISDRIQYREDELERSKWHIQMWREDMESALEEFEPDAV